MASIINNLAKVSTSKEIKLYVKHIARKEIKLVRFVKLEALTTNK